MKQINLNILIVIFLTSLASTSCNQTSKSYTREKTQTERENEQLKKENELLKKELASNQNSAGTAKNQPTVIQQVDRSPLNNLNFLKELDGKYPFEVELFDNTDFTQRLKKLLGNSRYNFLKETWAVEIPIEYKNNVFVASGCQAHNCGSTNFIVVYDFPNDVMYAGIREEDQITTYSENGGSSEKIIKWANN